ncbi:MAG: PAS domain-containing protein, partial [Desulfobacterales bacterium]
MKSESYAGQAPPLDQRPDLARSDTLQTAGPFFLALSENAPDIVYVLGKDGTISYVNPAWQRVLGHRPDEVVGLRLGHFAPPEIEAQVNEVFERVLVRGRCLDAHALYLTTWEGEARHFSASGGV